MKKAYLFLLFLFLCCSFSSKAQYVLNADLEPFYHGVASGDPLTNQVIIWTRVTDAMGAATIPVDWQISTDTLFHDIVNSGSVNTDATKDFTVKVDVTGLAPGTLYYYRFFALGKYSLMGRTKTVPSGNVDNLRFAVVSCSNYEAGYFNAYQQMYARNDFDAVIHLGDYIYEYGNGEFGSTRNHVPTTEIITLDDYRTRHAQYKLDIDLMPLHQQYPFLTVWDDHETANNAWTDGAGNHDSGEGAWSDRKSAGIQAYFEWLPIRPPSQGLIYRKISYGDLADIFLLDTRLEDRDEQAGTTGSPANDPNRELLGPDQFNWLTSGMGSSTAKWKVLAQQVMMGPLELFGTGLNEDQWDGYRAERANLYNYIQTNNIDNIVVLTGDIHTSWANELPGPGYNSTTGANSIGVEFVTTSVTSPGFPIAVGENIIRLANPNIKYVDLTEHGFMILDLDQSRVQSDWYFVNTVDVPDYNSSWDVGFYADDGVPNLIQATAPSVSQTTPCEEAPFTPIVTIQAEMILEGAFEPSGGLMQNDLYTAGLLPLNQPFNRAPWNYGGQEQVFNYSEIPTNAIDWVLIELRDPTNPSILVEQRAGFLLDNGAVVDPDGVTNGINFYNAERNVPYHIAAKSRNHVAVVTGSPVLDPSGTLVDFTDPGVVAGGVGQLVNLGLGDYGLLAGDTNSNGIITVDDFNAYLLESSGINDYLDSDCSLDKHVTVRDFNLQAKNMGHIGNVSIQYP